MQLSQQLLDKSVRNYTTESLFRPIVLEMKIITVYQPNSFSEYDDYEIVSCQRHDLIVAHKRTSNSAQQRVGSRKSNRWMECEKRLLEIHGQKQQQWHQAAA